MIGHFRHESGHYYWSLVSEDVESTTMFKEYLGTLRLITLLRSRYYHDGPSCDWHSSFISTYATFILLRIGQKRGATICTYLMPFRLPVLRV